MLVTWLQELADRAKPTVQRLNNRFKPLETGATLGTQLFYRTPHSMQRAALEPALNHALQALVDQGELDFLTDRICAIAVKGTDKHWNISLQGSRLQLIKSDHSDVTISATIPAFMKLLSQQTDPDTLFFERQLSIEGDVELGLHVKNLLDALDEDDLPLVWQQLLKVLRQTLVYTAA